MFAAPGKGTCAGLSRWPRVVDSFNGFKKKGLFQKQMDKANIAPIDSTLVAYYR